MRASIVLLMLLLVLVVPTVGRAQSCDVTSEPWQAVQRAWRASYDRPMSVVLWDHAQAISTQAGVPQASLEVLQHRWWLVLGAQVLALSSVLCLLLVWRSIRRGAWLAPTLALSTALVSIGLSYAGGRDLWLAQRLADVRMTPDGASAVVDHVARGAVGECQSAPHDPTFCFWQAQSGSHGWIESRAIVALSASCDEH